MTRLSAMGFSSVLIGTFLFSSLVSQLVAPSPAGAQGVLVVVDHHPVPLPRPIIRPRPRPEPPTSYKIKELAVQARITDQVARVNVSQSFVNTGSRQMEVSFVFPLPYDGAVDSLTLLVDGKEYPAKLLDAKEARKIYEGYIRRNQDPALLEWVGTGMFKTSVFPVPAGAERKVTMRYSQLLRKDHAATDFLFPLGTAKYTSKPVEKVQIDVSIESSEKIKSVYSPTHANLTIERPDKTHARVSYTAKDTVPASDFRLFYDTSKSSVGASVLSYRPDADEDGYLLLLASPEIKAKNDDRPKKTVVFVVDRSGSMSGKKIDQVKEAAKFVIGTLRQGDTFNIVAYDSAVESFRPELEKFNDDTRNAANGFIESLYAGGATNIDGALSTALEMIKDKSRPNYIVFLTDGLPTAGVTKEMQIVENARKNNDLDARIISFGVGYDVNARLLDRISRACNGKSEFVRPNEDIEAHVGRVAQRISSPVMTDVEVSFEFDEERVEEGKLVNRIYPKGKLDLFEGEQLILAARYKKPGQAKVVVTGQVGDKKQKLDFPAELVKKSKDESYAFVEKLWAVRRIGEIIDELDLHGENKELVQELVSLSTRHGIITPYTSFLADDTGEIKELADARKGAADAPALAQVRRELSNLERVSGRSGFGQRQAKKAYQEAAQAPAADNFGGFAGGGQASGGSGPGLRYRDAKTDEERVVDSVRNIGSKTLYKRGDTWIDGDASDEDLAKNDANVQDVKRFSEEYFKLVKANNRSENLLFAQQQEGEELIVRLRGQTYRIR